MKNLLTVLAFMLTYFSWAQAPVPVSNYNISINNVSYLTVANDLTSIKFDTLFESFKSTAANQSWVIGSAIQNTKVSCTIAGKTYYLYCENQQVGAAIKTTTNASVASNWNISSMSLKLLTNSGQPTTFQINNANGIPKLGTANQLWKFTMPFFPVDTNSLYTFSTGTMTLTADSANNKPATVLGSLLMDNSQKFIIKGSFNAATGKISGAHIIAFENVYLAAPTRPDIPILCMLSKNNNNVWEIQDDGFGNLHIQGKIDGGSIGWLDLANNEPLLQELYSENRPTQKWKFSRAIRSVKGWEK